MNTLDLHRALLDAAAPLDVTVQRHLLDAAAAGRDHDLLAKLAARADTDPEIRRTALAAGNQTASRAWLASGNAPEDVLVAAAADRRIGVREALAGVPGLAAELYRTCVRDGHPRIVEELAYNPDVPAALVVDAIITGCAAGRHDKLAGMFAQPFEALNVVLAATPSAHDGLVEAFLDAGTAPGRVGALLGDLPGLSPERWQTLVDAAFGTSPVGPRGYAVLLTLTRSPHATPQAIRPLATRARTCAAAHTFHEPDLRTLEAGKPLPSRFGRPFRDWSRLAASATRRNAARDILPSSLAGLIAVAVSGSASAARAGALALRHPDLSVGDVTTLACPFTGIDVDSDLTRGAAGAQTDVDVKAAIVGAFLAQETTEHAVFAADPARFVEVALTAHTSLSATTGLPPDLARAAAALGVVGPVVLAKIRSPELYQTVAVEAARRLGGRPGALALFEALVTDDDARTLDELTELALSLTGA